MRKRHKKQSEKSSTVDSALKLIIALALELEIEPDDLAATFSNSSECQTYYDRLLSFIERKP